MATVNEQIVTGRAYRVLIDKATKLWQKISFWTKGSDVEFNDGNTAETKVGAIDGITDSLVSTSSRIAASAKSVATLNNNLDGCTLERRADGVYITYTPPGGADPVSKKLGKPDADYQLVLQPTPSHIHIPTLGCNMRVYTDDTAGQWYGDIQITGVQSIRDTSGHAFLSSRIRGSFDVTVECKSYKYLYIDNTHTWGGTFFVQYL